MKKTALRTQLTLGGFLSVAIPLGIVAIFSVWRGQQTTRLTDQATHELTDREFTSTLTGLTDLTALAQRQLQTQLDSNLRMADEFLARAHGIHEDTTVTTAWQARSQADGAVQTISLPRVRLGGVTELGQTTDFKQTVPLIDDLSRVTGGVATIFQRMNSRGDMLRIATSVRTAEGTRAIGTYLPAVDAAGNPNAVIAALLAGETFNGRALVVGHWMITGYRPLKDTQGKVIGALFVGLSEADAFAHISDSIARVRVGANGRALVLRASGADHGRCLAAGDPALAGADLWAVTDAAGHPYLQDLIQSAVALPAGETGLARVTLAGGEGSTGARRYLRYMYFAAWDWVIVLSADEDELFATSRAMNASLERDLVRTLIISVIALIVAAGAWLVFGRRIARRIHALAHQIDAGSTRISSAAGVSSNASQTLAAGASQQAAAIEQTHGVLIEATSTARRNAADAQQARTSAQRAHTLAQAGVSEMQRMQAAMEGIRQSSNEITQIIQTIDAIAFQTNILALNAAVEAARAGEAGAGFAVVADEVRTLAQRCAVAAKETAAKIETANTRSIDGATRSALIATSLQEILTTAGALDNAISGFAQSSHDQDRAMVDLTSAMDKINHVTQSNAATAEETASAAEELRAQSVELQSSAAALRQLVTGDDAPI